MKNTCKIPMKPIVMLAFTIVVMLAVTATAFADSGSDVEITTKAEQSGNPLSRATFTVHRIIDSQPIKEITTDENGTAAISLSPGEYYLSNASVSYGYSPERARIFFSVTESDVTIEVTIQVDGDVDIAEGDNITVPKTGELPPILNYTLGIVFLIIAMLCGTCLVGQNKPEQNSRMGVSAYA